MLADDDAAGRHALTAIGFDTEPLRIRIAAVADRALPFLCAIALLQKTESPPAATGGLIVIGNSRPASIALGCFANLRCRNGCAAINPLGWRDKLEGSVVLDASIGEAAEIELQRLTP